MRQKIFSSHEFRENVIVRVEIYVSPANLTFVCSLFRVCIFGSKSIQLHCSLGAAPIDPHYLRYVFKSTINHYYRVAVSKNTVLERDAPQHQIGAFNSAAKDKNLSPYVDTCIETLPTALFVVERNYRKNCKKAKIIDRSAADRSAVSFIFSPALLFFSP